MKEPGRSRANPRAILNAAVAFSSWFRDRRRGAVLATSTHSVREPGGGGKGERHSNSSAYAVCDPGVRPGAAKIYRDEVAPIIDHLLFWIVDGVADG